MFTTFSKSFKLTFYRPFAKNSSCFSNVDVKDFNSQPFFIRFLFKSVFNKYLLNVGNTSPNMGPPKPKTDSDVTVGKKVSDMTQYYNPNVNEIQQSDYKEKIDSVVNGQELLLKSDKFVDNKKEYSILKPNANKLFNLTNYGKNYFLPGFSKLKKLFKEGDAIKTQINIDNILNKKSEEDKKTYSTFPGAGHATLINDAIDYVISCCQGKVNRLSKEEREDSAFARFLEILKPEKETIINIIHKLLSRKFVYSKNIDRVSLPWVATLIIGEIQNLVLLKKGLSWSSFKVPTGHSRVDNLFISKFVQQFFEQGKNSFILIKSSGKTKIKNTYFYTTIYIIKWSGTNQGFNKVINKFRYIELKNIPRVIPFPNWEVNPGGWGATLKIILNDKIKILNIPKHQSFKPSIRFLNIINYYQNQAVFVSKPIFDILLNNGHLFSGSYFSEERKPIFGTVLPFIEYVLLFIKYCNIKKKYVTEEILSLFCVCFYELFSNFLQGKKEAIWLSLYAEANLPLYLYYGFDFRGRDSIISLLNPIQSRLSRACLIFNHSSETVLSIRGIMHYTVFVFNLFSIENSPCKFKSYSSIILYVFKGVTPGPTGLITFVQKTVLQAPFIIKNQKKCLYYIPTFCNVGLISYIEIHLDAPASAFQILVTFSNSFEKASILNLVNHESGECQDPYSVWAIPTEEDIKKIPCLKDLTREIKKKFFILSLYGASKESIEFILTDTFGLDPDVANNFWDFLDKFYKNSFKKELKFIGFLYKKFKNSDEGVTINLPLYSIEFSYYETTEGLRIECNKKKKTKKQKRIRSSYHYSTGEVDGVRRKTAFNANLIQALDAHAKHYVVEEFRSKGYHIHAIHDCFKVHPNHADFAIAAYNRAIVNISEIFIEDLKDCKDFTCFTEEQKQQILNANYSINAF